MECAFNILYMSRISDVLLLAMLLAGPSWGSPGTRRKRSARRGVAVGATIATMLRMLWAVLPLWRSGRWRRPLRLIFCGGGIQREM